VVDSLNHTARKGCSMRVDRAQRDLQDDERKEKTTGKASRSDESVRVYVGSDRPVCCHQGGSSLSRDFPREEMLAAPDAV